jgi:hypothetical protein
VFTCILASSRISRSGSWKTDPSFLRWFCHKLHVVGAARRRFGHLGATLEHHCGPARWRRAPRRRVCAPASRPMTAPLLLWLVAVGHVTPLLSLSLSLSQPRLVEKCGIGFGELVVSPLCSAEECAQLSDMDGRSSLFWTRFGPGGRGNSRPRPLPLKFLCGRPKSGRVLLPCQVFSHGLLSLVPDFRLSLFQFWVTLFSDRDGLSSIMFWANLSLVIFLFL